MSSIHSSVRWESSTDDEEMPDTKYRVKLKDTLRNTQSIGSLSEENVVAPRKRGRGPSKRPCLNRNALMARENRQRKKAYLEKIENKLSFYQEENKTLSNTIRKQSIDIKRLTGEVAYLRSVLNNSTSIITLLKIINQGLKKTGPCKENSHKDTHGVPHMYSDTHNTLANNCTRPMNKRKNIVNNQNYDLTDILKEHLPQTNQSLLENSKCKDLNEKVLVLPCPGTDHTYTALHNSTVINQNSMVKKEGNNVEEIVSPFSQESEDSYTEIKNDMKDLDSILCLGETSLSNSNEQLKEDESFITDLDQYPAFNMDIFEDIPKSDMMDTIDEIRDSTTLFTEEDVFPSLNNAGVCLHVNSDKVSLEYCSVCHSNSKMSEMN